MEDEIPDTTCKEIYCEVCRHNIRKWGWAKHLNTKKHIENEKGVEEVEKKQCRKCGCWRVLELYRGENAGHMGIGKVGQRRMRRELGS